MLFYSGSLLFGECPKIILFYTLQKFSDIFDTILFPVTCQMIFLYSVFYINFVPAEAITK